MNSRRLIVAPRGQSHARHRVTAVRVLKRAERDVNCDQLFWAVNVGFGSHDRVKTGKTQNRKCFPVCPRKRTYLPILELLPPPTLRERRHCSLARRLITVRRRAIFLLPEGEVDRAAAVLHDARATTAVGASYSGVNRSSTCKLHQTK